MEKINATFHENDTISYYQKKTWFYDTTRSKGSLQDKITQLNTISVVRHWKKKNCKFLLKTVQKFVCSLQCIKPDIGMRD